MHAECCRPPGRRFLIAVALAALGALPRPAAATDAIFFEGIGTVPRSMGGTALAYDVGGSALANNPATMLLMPAGQAAAFEINADSANTLDVRDLATGDVATTDRWPLFHAYYSPNLNYVWREGEFAAGIGLFSQGGLGTQYGHDSFLSRLPSGAATGLDVSSKALFLRAPLAAAYQVTPELAISGAFQGVFAGLSLSNLAGADQLATVISQGRASGSLLPGLAAITGATGGAYFSFWRSPEVQFGTDAFGISGRLGATYAFDDATRLGIDYQFRTLLPDLSGSTGRVVAVSPAGTQFSLPGSFRVLDFQLPADFGVGLSHAFTPDLLLAFDYHHTLWQGAFQALKIRFRADAGGDAAVDIPQSYRDMNIFSLGLQYRVMPDLALRAGGQVANQPVLSNQLLAIAPVITTAHASIGLSYAVTESLEINVAYIHAFAANAANRSPPNVSATAPIQVVQSQDNFSLGVALHF